MKDHPDLDVNWTNGTGSKWSALHAASIHAASIHGHVEVVKLLLAHAGINVNVKDKHGHSPLSLGCLSGHVPVIQVLLKDAWVNVTQDDKEGCTPLWRAAFFGKHEIVEWLIESGRDLGDVKNKKGQWGQNEFTAL